ncbi:hypothetical protein Tco_0861156 [Tanacetum coccineum]|uniref:Uncharacterized protein n=1 Tax=Tanacetum coccineum TaxID=301880 RepID=A0ABQ5BL43_9ASTR
MVEPEPTLKNPIKAQIQRDAEIAQRLFEEEQLKFEREKRIARERAAEQEAKDAALIKQIKYIQARMDANELLAEILQQEEREQFTVDEQARMLVDLIAKKKRFFAAQRAEKIRNKPPTKAQLKNKMKLYEREQKWINDFVLMDYEVVKDKELSYWKITRADGSSKFYKVFSTMLEEFDRQDLFNLHRLVMERFQEDDPECYDLILWGRSEDND